MSQALNAWMNGELVGRWIVDRGAHSFHYDKSWVTSVHCRALSLSLPINAALEVKGVQVKNYFDNLLPDNEKIRSRLGKRFHAKADTFSLLTAIGRDCVGAIQLLPEGANPDGWNRVTCDALTDAQVANILQMTASDEASSHAEQDDFFRISIAGAQEKTAFTRFGNRWCRPQGSTPTTHIFKLPLGTIAGGGLRVNFSDSVHNEWLCAQIMSALGLPTATTSIATFGNETVLVVERFDRQWMDDGTWIARLPQEDFCQALGQSPETKYEKHGGPGMHQCLQLLQGSVDKRDTVFFILSQLAFFLMAAPDGHAKNFSLFLQRGDIYEMTPLYDVLSAWPYMGGRANQLSRHKAGLAMALRSKNAHYLFNEIHARHWYQLAMKNGGAATWHAMLQLVNNIDGILNQVEAKLPKDFPARTSSTIFAGMRAEAKRFISEPTH